MNSLEDTINEIAKLLENLSKAAPNTKEESTIKNELSKLLDDAETLQCLQFTTTHECVIKDHEIALYLDKNSSQKYIIINTLTKDYIGEIIYNKTDDENAKKYGNISYYIRDNKRGNNYAYKALNLLTDFLYKKGTKSIYIAAKQNNIASIKTIEQFGGEKCDFSNNDTHLYYCDLDKIKKVKNKNPR